MRPRVTSPSCSPQATKSALCEQMADPATCKGIVPRQVVRVITPALVTNPDQLRCAQQPLLGSHRQPVWLGARAPGPIDGGAQHLCLRGRRDVERRAVPCRPAGNRVRFVGGGGARQSLRGGVSTGPGAPRRTPRGRSPREAAGRRAGPVQGRGPGGALRSIPARRGPGSPLRGSMHAWRSLANVAGRSADYRASALDRRDRTGAPRAGAWRRRQHRRDAAVGAGQYPHCDGRAAAAPPSAGAAERRR